MSDRYSRSPSGYARCSVGTRVERDRICAWRPDSGHSHVLAFLDLAAFPVSYPVPYPY